MKTRWIKLLLGALFSLGSASLLAPAPAHPLAQVDADFIRANVERNTPDWPHVGVDHAETRFSRLQ